MVIISSQELITYSTIDTLQYSECASNRNNLDIKLPATEQYYNQLGKLITKINPNVSVSGKIEYKYRLSATKESLNTMFEMLTVIDQEKMMLNRVDICTDIDMEYSEHDNSRFLYLMHQCLSYGFSKTKDYDFMYTQGPDYKLKNLRAKNSHYEIVFYDKANQSDDKHEFGTRVEVRYKRLSNNDLKTHIRKTLKLYRNCIKNFEYVEEREAQNLIELYESEKKIHDVEFTEFVYANTQYITTMGIMKRLYEYTGQTTPYKKWVFGYRQRHTLNLFTKTDITKFTKLIISSIKEYINS